MSKNVPTTLRVARWGLAIGAAVVAIESALATRAVAVEAGAVHDSVTAWLTPIGIEGLAAAFVALRLYLASSDEATEKRHAYGAFLAAALFGALAVWINVSAADGAPLIGKVIAGAKPVGLMLAAHLYPWEQVRKARASKRPKQGPASARKAPAPVQTTPARAQAPAQSAREAIAPRKVSAQKRIAEVARIDAERKAAGEPELRHTELAALLGWSRDAIRRDRIANAAADAGPGDEDSDAA